MGCIELTPANIGCSDSVQGVRGGDDFVIIRLADIATFPTVSGSAATAMPVMVSGKKAFRVFQREGMLKPMSEFTDVNAGFKHSVEFAMHTTTAAQRDIANAMTNTGERFLAFVLDENGTWKWYGLGGAGSTVSAHGLCGTGSGSVKENPLENGGGIIAILASKENVGEKSLAVLSTVSAGTIATWLTANLAA